MLGDSRGRAAMRMAGALIIAFGLGALASFTCTSLQGCASTPRRVAHTAIVSAGSAVAEVERANLDAYERATDELRGQLARDGQLARYTAAVVPYDAEFDARTHAVMALSAALYAAAGINDAARAGPVDVAAIRRAAARVLVAIDALLGELDTGHVLPRVEIPASLRTIVTTLRSLAGPALDGGTHVDAARE